jgi:glycosyltransferase involved in cell wall biosynthesis
VDRVLIIPAWLDSTNCYAEYLIRNLGNEFIFEKNYSENVNYNEYDLIIPLYATHGLKPDMNQKKIARIVYEGHECHAIHKDNTIGASSKLVQKFSKNWLGNKKVMYVPFLIDENLFKPFKIARANKKFQIGYIGSVKNPRKNYEEVIKPLSDIPGCELSVSPAWENPVRNWHGVPNFINSIDVLVIGSSFEGFCLPMLESASCGKPIISTRVGIVEEFPGVRVVESNVIGSEMLDKAEVSQRLRKEIEYLRDHLNEAKEMGIANRQEVLKKWTWEKGKHYWREFIKKGVENGRNNELGYW